MKAMVRELSPQADGRAHAGRIRLGGLVFLILLAVAGAPSIRGQRAEKCNESTVRKKSTVPVTQSAAEDIYANTTTSKGPHKEKRKSKRFGRRTWQSEKIRSRQFFPLTKLLPRRRGTWRTTTGKPTRKYDLASTGQHIAYEVEYMKVWKVNGGVCQVEGIFSRPDKLSGINK